MHWTTREDCFVEESGDEPSLKEEELEYDSFLEAVQEGEMFDVSDDEIEMMEWKTFAETMKV